MRVFDLTARTAQPRGRPVLSLMAYSVVHIYSYANDNGFWRTPCNAS